MPVKYVVQTRTVSTSTFSVSFPVFAFRYYFTVAVRNVQGLFLCWSSSNTQCVAVGTGNASSTLSQPTDVGASEMC